MKIVKVITILESEFSETSVFTRTLSYRVSKLKVLSEHFNTF